MDNAVYLISNKFILVAADANLVYTTEGVTIEHKSAISFK